MALNIKIDFENRYPVDVVDTELRNSTFDSPLVDGSIAHLAVKISAECHPLMQDVYNVSLGPFDDAFEIDDKIKLKHQEHSKVFSSIVFACIPFLNENPEKFCGLDGSDTARAYMYYRCIQNNFDYLSNYFELIGMKYYARIFREEGTALDLDDIMVVPTVIVKDEQIRPEKLYNYFIFKLKE